MAWSRKQSKQAKQVNTESQEVWKTLPHVLLQLL